MLRLAHEAMAMMRLRAGIVLALMGLVLALALFAFPQPAAPATGERALVLEVDGVIGPPIADYIVHELNKAKPDRAADHSADEHARRARHLDAPDHWRDPGLAHS